MSDIFFQIMNIQPNDNEFLDAVRDSNSKETAYKLGFMHGRAYAAQMADESSHRDQKAHERLSEVLRELLHHLPKSDGWTLKDMAIDNANLIAAAPELYEAINCIDFDDGMIAEALGGELQDKINSALAKARGELEANNE